uniref:Uncharacterized protein n=1 Tax=Glossina palpalis gambiensis TaxID=67801 RepID=A0A1B0BRX2_9MUSC
MCCLRCMKENRFVDVCYEIEFYEAKLMFCVYFITIFTIGKLQKDWMVLWSSLVSKLSSYRKVKAIIKNSLRQPRQTWHCSMVKICRPAYESQIESLEYAYEETKHKLNNVSQEPYHATTEVEDFDADLYNSLATTTLTSREHRFN